MSHDGSYDCAEAHDSAAARGTGVPGGVAPL